MFQPSLEFTALRECSLKHVAVISSVLPADHTLYGYGGLVFLWSNFPSLMVDYYVQLGNLLLLITSPILI